ncbi:MAG: GTPase HflX [Oscillospiraceae bacterium]|nr:GTPase HflX [Oscillospiraceae bacterium]
METISEKRERAVLAGLSAASMDESERSTEQSMEELAALVDTAGGDTVAIVMQSRSTPDPRSFIGDGKVQELKELIAANDCDLAVFDNELSPSQMRVLSEELGVKVLDRSGLILDIFAQRAQTREGKLQVELAQYKYLLPRLTGMWTHLVRQTASGGRSPIGTRGPGETQLETDRRHIRRKLQKLEEELAAVRKVRSTQRRRREKNAMPVVALVGYTNAGKSTLLNRLTGAGIPANDRLFDTLDTTTRRLMVDETTEILLSDTVGFIRKLPHHLVEAFKATLEELSYADVLLHVIDISSPEWEEQARVVDTLIRQLGAEATPCLHVYNKCDAYFGILPHGEDLVCLSAKSGEGTDALVARLSQMLARGKRRVTLRLPYVQAGLVDLLNREGAVLRLDYGDEGIDCEAIVTPNLYGRLKDYIPDYREEKEPWED